jgi:hypothetical protein
MPVNSGPGIRRIIDILMRRGRSCTSGAARAWVCAGRGPADPGAAKLDCTALSGGSFRHGPIELSGPASSS